MLIAQIAINSIVYIIIIWVVALLVKKPVLSGLIFGISYGGSYELGHADFISYRHLYSILAAPPAPTLEQLLLGHYEPIYATLMHYASEVGLPFYASRVALYCVAGWILFASLNASKVREKSLFVALFLSLTSFTHLYSLDRQSVAVLVGLAALIRGNLWMVLIATGFHYTSLIFITSFAWKYFIPATMLTIFAALMAFTIDLELFNIILSKYSYFDFGYFDLRISSLIMASAFVGLYVSRVNYLSDRRLVWFCTLSLVICLLTFGVEAIFYRLKIYFICAALILWFSTERPAAVSPKLERAGGAILTVVLVIFYVTADQFAFLPYQNVLLSWVFDYVSKEQAWTTLFNG